MNHMRYKGKAVLYQGKTALTRWLEDRFLVQWDDLSLPESHGWHEYDPGDFEYTKETIESFDPTPAQQFCAELLKEKDA
jgi:hypothetical protein